MVASFTDAWIETEGIKNIASESVSHPLRMRGLKLKSAEISWARRVASFTDAWIETKK